MKYLEYLDDAVMEIRRTDHLAYITYPLIKDKRLVLQMLTNIYSSIIDIVSAVLQYEYIFKRISLSQDSRQNLDNFRNKCAPRYGINLEELRVIGEVIGLVEKHKNSQFEFTKKDRVVIMNENMQLSIVSIEKVKSYLMISKNILKKVEEIIRKGI